METTTLQTVKQNRVMEIEIMKAVAIIAMVFVHVFEMSAKVNVFSYQQHTAAFVIEFFGCIPSAGVFMFAMGWGASYSKRATPQTYVRRSLALFILGLVINIFEEYVPAILVPGSFGPLSGILPSILGTDIYFFAALMSLYFALMKKLESQKKLAVAVSVLLLAICFSVNILVGFESFTTGNEWMDTIVGLLIRVNEYSYFPFISWSIYPILGLGLGTCFQKTTMKKALIFAIVSGIVALALFEYLIRVFGMMDASIVDVVDIREGYYYSLHPFYAMIGYGVIALEFVLVHFILLVSRQRFPAFLLTMSKNVTQIYIVQWFFIGLISPVLVSLTSIWANILIGEIVLFVSYIGGNLLKKTNLIKV